MKRVQTLLLSAMLLFSLVLSGCEGISPSTSSVSYDLENLPEYSGDPYVRSMEMNPSLPKRI